MHVHVFIDVMNALGELDRIVLIGLDTTLRIKPAVVAKDLDPLF